MGTLDRYIIRSLVVNYLIALAVMMSLYIVLDLFFNMDEFTEGSQSTLAVFGGILSYYGTNLFKYFSQLSGVITVVAGMLTLGRLRRTNELTAVLASGVSLYRVAVPVIAFGIATTLLWFVDMELIIPSMADRLARRHDDPRGERTYAVRFLNDRDGALLSAQQFLPSTGRMRRMLVMIREETGAVREVIEAEEAQWEPQEGHPAGGRWKLERATRRRQVMRGTDTIGPQEQMEEELVRYYSSDLTPRDIQMRQSSQWLRFLSSRQLGDLADLGLPDARNLARIRHERFTTPVVNVVMLLLGIPFLLKRMPGNLVGDAAKCLIVCGLCFVVSVVGRNLSPATLPALPSWLPIIIFTPLSVVLLDRIKT
ncbi:MAG: LptF/LptG family permease [Phycisphaerales bacterium]|nr:MAG: LptF/LptG family permease [Phycisphaerales bacterium]